MGELSGLIATMLWSISNVLVRSQAERLDMLSANALRLLATAPIALVIPYLLGPIGTPVSPSCWAWVYVVAGTTLTMAVGDLAFYVAQNILGVSRTQPISNSFPVFTMLLAAVYLREPPTVALIGATGLVILGTYFLLNKADDGAVKVALGHSTNRYWGLALALGAGLCWAVGTTLFREGLKGMDVATANQIRVPAVALIVVAMLPLSGRSVRLWRYGWSTVGVMAVVGITSLGIGSLFFLYCIQTVGATKAAIIQTLSPVFAAPVAVAFLGERMTWRTAAGIVLCIAGGWLVMV